MKYNTGEVYEGNWKNDKKHGIGKFKYKNGDVYEGNWENDKKHGNGKMEYINGNVYNGEWKDNEKYGNGTMKYNNGDVYEGDWENNNRNGHGTITYFNGDVYKGGWKYNQYDKNGIMEYKNGDVYDGEWKDNGKNGRGKIKYKNGDVYKGEWKYNEKHGHGKMEYKNGDVYEGDWENNNRNGHGTITYFNGDVYKGGWKYDQYDGIGKLIFTNGKILEGSWIHGAHASNVNKKIIINDIDVFKNPMLISDKTINIDKDANIKYIHDNVDKTIYNSENKSIMILYSFNGDVLINSYLRNGKKISESLIKYFNDKYYLSFREHVNIFINDDKKFIHSYIERFYELLKECFKTKFDRNIIVYRGLIKDPLLKKNDDVSDFILNNYFISTSYLLSSAQNFLRTEEGALLEIEIPSNTYICPIFLSSRFSHEAEILLPDNSCFYIKNIREKTPETNYMVYELLLIPNIEDYHEYDLLNDQMITKKKYITVFDKTLIPEL